MIYILVFLILTFNYFLGKLFDKNRLPIVISIEGNIGSGKTKLIEELKNNLSQNKNIIFLKEPSKYWNNLKDKENNNILYKFYNDKKRWSYTFQNFAYLTRAKLLLNSINENKYNYFQNPKIIITERSIETDKNVFTKMLYEEKHITDLEYKLYNEWFDYLYPEIKVKNIVYLRTLPETAYERMSNNSKNEDYLIPKDYLQMIHKFHDDWLTKNNENYNICYLNGEKNINFDLNHVNKIKIFIESLS
tara:strand:+ start:39 stop:779 length:741 start_codon:yes stop_codon:yes gene_type:complete